MKKITIDASGSMEPKVEEIRSGLKMISKEIKDDIALGGAKIRTIVTQFSSPCYFKELVNSQKAEKLTEKLADAYTPQGMTALFDSIGQGFQLVPEGQNFVLVTILTDGQENSSQEYDQAAVTKLISDKKAGTPAWTITFMGTTEQAMRDAASWGVSRGNSLSVSNDGKGFNKSMRSYSKMRKVHYNISTGRTRGANMDNLAKNNEA
jgi:hypothetical protein